MAGCNAGQGRERKPDFTKVPLGLPPVPVPPTDPFTVPKAELGWRLFYDRRLASKPGAACADCHQPEHGFAGTDATHKFHRNVPTALNRAYGEWEFWDGAAGRTLEELIGGVLAFVNKDSDDRYWDRIATIPGYRVEFRQVFGREPDAHGIVQALATYQRTLLAGNAPFDRAQAGDASALSETARRGQGLFFGPAGCADCHRGPNFTDEKFHNIGIGQREPYKQFYTDIGRHKPPYPELGRFNRTQRPEDLGAFKTPTLRELDHTDPYMHDGSLATLAEVVDYYNQGGERNANLDPRIKPLGLTDSQKADLIAFLHALSTDGVAPPTPVLPK